MFRHCDWDDEWREPGDGGEGTDEKDDGGTETWVLGTGTRVWDGKWRLSDRIEVTELVEGTEYRLPALAFSWAWRGIAVLGASLAALFGGMAYLILRGAGWYMAEAPVGGLLLAFVGMFPAWLAYLAAWTVARGWMPLTIVVRENWWTTRALLPRLGARGMSAGAVTGIRLTGYGRYLDEHMGARGTLGLSFRIAASLGEAIPYLVAERKWGPPVQIPAVFLPREEQEALGRDMAVNLGVPFVDDAAEAATRA